MLLSGQFNRICNRLSQPATHRSCILNPRRDRKTPELLCMSNARELWGYPTSCVRTMELDSFRLMHRASFSHRNLRTYILVVYVPGSTRCAAIENEIERLATGLIHNKQVVVAKLDSLSSTEAFTFCTSVLEARQYPTVFMYPEGTPGFMRFTGSEVTAEGILSALNGCYNRVLSNRQPLKLLGLPTHGSLAPVLSAEAVQQSRPREPKINQKVEQQQQIATGVVNDLSTEKQGYWTPGKAVFWSFVILFSLSAFVWDKWGEDWWDLRELRDRQRKRKMGVAFDEDTNAEDLMTLSLYGAKRTTYPQDVDQTLQANNESMPESVENEQGMQSNDIASKWPQRNPRVPPVPS